MNRTDSQATLARTDSQATLVRAESRELDNIPPQPAAIEIINRMRQELRNRAPESGYASRASLNDIWDNQRLEQIDRDIRR